jgi:predicted nucleotidyltransferase
MSEHENIVRIKAVYDALQELAQEVIFVGGATVSLYADRPAGEIRPTDDIDILIELLHYKDYSAIEEKLRKKGFVNDIESGVICRYIINGITVDVMATSGEILGFANRWYAEAFTNSQKIILEGGYSIKIFSAPYFLATKMEAYKSRGGNDGRTSTDFEDIVYVLNNRTTIWKEMAAAPENLKQYLKTELGELVSQPYIDEWISSHLDYNEQRRGNFIIGSMEEFVAD